ncbi:MAG: T9SS type A sorting domain-containing protein [Saprospiraceae bacterium]|nr:T9SS type A sorting domain-containing protein [Saprospiraceae bacterium]
MKNICILLVFTLSSIQAQNLIFSEQFTACTLPEQWKLHSETGPFSFAVVKSSLMPQSDATCTIVYQQTDKNNNNARKFSIESKPYTLFRYNNYMLSFGLRFQKAGTARQLNLYSQFDGSKKLLQSYTSDVFQNGLSLVVQNINIQPAAGDRSIQFSFEYEASGNDANTVVLIDNLSLTGPDNDDCSRAVDLILDDPCLSGNNTGALMTGPKIICEGNYSQALWYKLLSNYTGYVRLITGSAFNDAVSVYEGSCASLTDLQCHNTDEFGFGGEKNYFQIEAGKTYYFRVAKQIGYYGREDLADLCVSIIREIPVYPDPEACLSSKLIHINSACLSENNRKAKFDAPEPSLNTKSRADVWYHFTPTSSTPIEIISHANFADVLSLYKGNCDNLSEIQCEDLGGKLIFNKPVANTKYWLQVSGYFSTIEGDLCIEIKERTTQKPANDDCVSSTPIVLGASCISSQNTNSSPSGIKGSCQVYDAPDIWYSFIAPAEKEIALHIQAGFMYNYVVYEGPCNKLTEIHCGKTPDPCNGFISLRGLTAGKTYYLQVTAVVHPLKLSEANICVKIDALSQTNAFQALELNLSSDCLHGVLGRISYDVKGGTPPYDYSGPATDEYFLPGTNISAFIQDASGCRDFVNLTIGCEPPQRCKNSNLDIEVQSTCLKDSIGRQTGEVILNFNGMGGSGVYYYYGTPNGSTLKHGDIYTLILIDSDSCYVIEEGKINCPPFDCNQSALKIQADYLCIDTLLKAQLQIQVSGDLGGFTLSGNQNGELLEQGQKFKTSVIDGAGCQFELEGEIKCNFDSCAYARPELNVTYDCLTHPNGDRTGKAILLVSGFSHAGGLQYIGNHPGDTLNHTDFYSVQLIDSFGCGLTSTGIIDCLPVNTNAGNSLDRFTLYPNPSDKFIYLDSPVELNENPELQLISSSGKNYHMEQLKHLNQGRIRYQINIEHLPSGIYYLKISHKTANDLFRFVKI